MSIESRSFLLGQPMRQLLIAAFEGTVHQIEADAGMMPLERWNESVFRFLYSRALATLAPDVTQLFECDRIDLVLQHKSERAFVEFKFYDQRSAHDPLTGRKRGFKGGPSPQNYREFENSVSILRGYSVPPEVLKLVALFYCDPIRCTGKTFDDDYGEGSGVEDSLKVRRLDWIRPFSPKGSEKICYPKLYEVCS